MFHRQWELSVSAVTGEEGEEIRSHSEKKKKKAIGEGTEKGQDLS